MKLGKLMISAQFVAASVLLVAGCSRNRQEAVIKSNEGDKAVAINPEGAIAKYEEAVQLDPSNHRIFFKLAMAQKKKEDWDKVASTLARATQLAPKFANYWFERGWALEQLAKKKTVQWEETKEPFQKCIENDPNYAECYEQLGFAFLWTDDEQKALDNFTKAIEHDPHNIAYYAALSDLYIRLGYMKEAESVLQQAKTMAKPGDKALYGVHVLLSEVLQDKGDSPGQVTELELAKAAAPAEGPEAVQILYSLGSTYATLSPPRTQEAIAMLKGFNARACKGSKAASYKVECETASTLVAKLHGTLQ
jgi:tetratricopeptide (TPR) repeat protein